MVHSAFGIYTMEFGGKERAMRAPHREPAANMARASRAVIEARALNAIRRVFGRYGVDIADLDMVGSGIRSAMERMNAKEYTLVVSAYAAVMSANGRFVPPAEKLSEAEMWRRLQERAYHFKNHPEDLPKVPGAKPPTIPVISSAVN